jgi:phosphopantetheine adenylyltransferase
VFISSRFIREIAKYGGDVTAMVPAAVVPRLLTLDPDA